MFCQRKQDAAVQLQLIACDAYQRRARDMQQLHQTSPHVDLSDHQLTHVVDVQREVIIETTSTADCVQHQRHQQVG